MKTHKTIKEVKTFKKACIVICGALLGLTATVSNAQTTETEVSGVIKSIYGPIPNATVVLKNTAIGVMANEEGVFEFPQKLKEGDVLVASSFGHTDREYTVSSYKPYMEMILEENPIIIVGALRTSPVSKKPKMDTF